MAPVVTEKTDSCGYVFVVTAYDCEEFERKAFLQPGWEKIESCCFQEGLSGVPKPNKTNVTISKVKLIYSRESQ